MAVALGGEADLAELKAAFTLNFLKFIETRQDRDSAAAEAIGVCVVGRLGVAKALGKAANSNLMGRPVHTVLIELPADVSACSVLYFEEFDLDRDRRFLGAVASSPILTVSDLPDFAQKGGMIQLLAVNNRLRFAVNLGAVRRAGLRLNPKLLKLALRVNEGDVEKP